MQLGITFAPMQRWRSRYACLLLPVRMLKLVASLSRAHHVRCTWSRCKLNVAYSLQQFCTGARAHNVALRWLCIQPRHERRGRRPSERQYCAPSDGGICDVWPICKRLRHEQHDSGASVRRCRLAIVCSSGCVSPRCHACACSWDMTVTYDSTCRHLVQQRCRHSNFTQLLRICLTRQGVKERQRIAWSGGWSASCN